MIMDPKKLRELSDRFAAVSKSMEQAITEIDLLLHEWQEAMDMMSFIGVNASFELWTDDNPPRIVTKEALSQMVGKELRVMHHVDGAWTKVGVGKVDKDGILTAEIHEDIPELRDGLMNRFSISPRGEWKPLPSQRAFEPGVPLTHIHFGKNGEVIKNLLVDGVLPKQAHVSIDRVDEQNLWPEGDDLLDDHPFFNHKE
jgi:hypothetical protein